MDKRIEDVVIRGIELLQERNDKKTLDMLRKKKYFFTVINCAHELNLYIDPTMQMSPNMTWEFYETHSMKLYSEFQKIPVWYKA